MEVGGGSLVALCLYLASLSPHPQIRLYTDWGCRPLIQKPGLDLPVTPHYGGAGGFWMGMHRPHLTPRPPHITPHGFRLTLDVPLGTGGIGQGLNVGKPGTLLG